MREGINPAKYVSALAAYKQHRIIIPVYIPEQFGYFKYSLEILDLCLRSLRCTTTGQYSITLISNGCASEVVGQLSNYYKQGWIDQLIINRENHGKLDSIMTVARGAYEELITFADCDALFYPGWLDAVTQIFNAFPEAGWVSSMPAPDTTWLNTTSTVFIAFSKGILKKRPVVAEENLNRFGESISRPEMYRSRTHECYLTVEREGVTGVVGGGHFSFSLRPQVFQKVPSVPSSRFISEEEFFGQPFDAAGYWRLSTPRLYVQHMGNIPEKWMYEDLERMGVENPDLQNRVLSPVIRPKTLLPYFMRRVFSKFIKKHHLMKFIPYGGNN